MNMQLYALKVFFLHLIVATVYLTAICYEFVIEKDPNPIGAGLKQWVCIFLHLMITLIIMAIVWNKANDKNIARKKFFVHFLAVLFIISASLLISDPLWHWLWSRRS